MTGTPLADSEPIRSMIDHYGRGGALAFLFDYDGTLTPIVRHPSLAKLDEATRRQLSRLIALPDVGMAVVSGRALKDVKELVGISGLFFAGSGGLDLDLQSRTVRYPRLEWAEVQLDQVTVKLDVVIRKYPGTWIERKPGAISIHFRGLSSMASANFRFDIVDVLAANVELRMRIVSEAIEVTPVDGWDKGTAVTMILEQLEKDGILGPRPLYFGDAENDTEGMAATTRAGGFTVGIGPHAPAISNGNLADTAELLEFLDQFSGELIRNRGLTLDEVSGSDCKPTEGASEKGLLVLDPDATVRRSLAKQMTSLGWRVWQAESSNSAIEIMNRNRDDIQVAIVDLQLPGLEGSRTLLEMAQFKPNLLRCFISADVRAYAADVFNRGSDIPLFVKPVQARDIDAMIQRLLHGRKSSAVDKMTTVS